MPRRTPEKIGADLGVIAWLKPSQRQRQRRQERIGLREILNGRRMPRRPSGCVFALTCQNDIRVGRLAEGPRLS